MKQTKFVFLSLIGSASMILTSCSKTQAGYTDRDIGFAGTVTQHAEVQAYATLRAARNAIDGMKVTDANFWKTGFDTADDAGGKLSSEFKVSDDKRNFYALNGAVTKANKSQFADATAVDNGIKQLDKTKHPEKSVWINLYNAGDNFLSTTYKPLLNKYAALLNLKLTFNDGDGTNESSVSDKLATGFDAYCVNLVRTNSAKTYTDKIKTYGENKPLIWFNRQPSDPTSGKLDDDALKFNDYTAYVGFDAAGGGAVQGKMIVDYIKEHINDKDKNGKLILDKNGDGTIGYVLCIGDQAHNDSQARTKGIREALGTWDGSYEAGKKKEGSIKVGDKTYKVVELEAQEMKQNSETWNAKVAQDTSYTWFQKRGLAIDMVVSNNDGMGMGAYTKWAQKAEVPTFGYDANTDAVAAIK